MKQGVVVDEMFPEGAGPYMDIDEVRFIRDLVLETPNIAHKM